MGWLIIQIRSLLPAYCHGFDHINSVWHRHNRSPMESLPPEYCQWLRLHQLNITIMTCSLMEGFTGLVWTVRMIGCLFFSHILPALHHTHVYVYVTVEVLTISVTNSISLFGTTDQRNAIILWLGETAHDLDQCRKMLNIYCWWLDDSLIQISNCSKAVRIQIPATE